jgi:hypothetical protein
MPRISLSGARFKYTIFISYTTREEPAKRIADLVRTFRDDLRIYLARLGAEDFVFFDAYTWEGGLPNETALASRWVSVSYRGDLEGELMYAMDCSMCMFAFISHAYFNSQWCRFEWNHMNRRRDLMCSSCPAPIAPVLWRPGEIAKEAHPYLCFNIIECVDRGWGRSRPDCWWEFIRKAALFVLRHKKHPFNSELCQLTDAGRG